MRAEDHQDETVSSSSALLYHLDSEGNAAQRSRKMTKIVLVAALVVVALVGVGAQYTSFGDGQGKRSGVGVSLKMEKQGSIMSASANPQPPAAKSGFIIGRSPSSARFRIRNSAGNPRYFSQSFIPPKTSVLTSLTLKFFVEVKIDSLAVYAVKRGTNRPDFGSLKGFCDLGGKAYSGKFTIATSACLANPGNTLKRGKKYAFVVTTSSSNDVVVKICRSNCYRRGRLCVGTAPSARPSCKPRDLAFRLAYSTNTVSLGSVAPTTSPTKSPTQSPTKNPSMTPTKPPTKNPTTTPTKLPSESPTMTPTKFPSVIPTKNPTMQPTASPTGSLTYSGQHEAGDLSVGQYVLIKSVYGGYLVDNDDGTVSTNPKYLGSTEEENMVFVVEQGRASNSYKFRNLATGKYLKGTRGNLQSTAINGSGLGASWRKDTDVFRSSTGTKQRYFGQLRSRYFQNKCASVTSTEMATVLMAVCADSEDQYFTFEIL